MRRIASAVLAVGLLAFVSLVTVVAFQQPKSPYPPAKPMTLASPATSAARGAQLVMLGGCNDCHTPKLPNGEPGVTRMLSGHPQDAPLAPEVKGGLGVNMQLTSWRGPWGMTLTRNLTPDKETGIGAWTLADFKKTLRTGVNPKGEILPPHADLHVPEPPGTGSRGDRQLPEDHHADPQRGRPGGAARAAEALSGPGLSENRSANCAVGDGPRPPGGFS